VIIPKGSRVVLPIMAINRSHTLWGDDAWEFRPERWMADLPPQAQEISGYRNLMTFIDGPRA
jgi:cytochrome P450